jgi:hypothetical protein
VCVTVSLTLTASTSGQISFPCYKHAAENPLNRRPSWSFKT